MSVGNKKTMSTVVYYTLAAITLAFAGFFIFALLVRDVAMWARIIYLIWTGLLIGTIVFDIICSTNGEGKSMSGLLVYILSLLALVMAGVLYFVNSGVTGLATEFFNLFISVSLLSIFTTGFMIATWVVGEHLIEHSTENKELENSKM